MAANFGHSTNGSGSNSRSSNGQASSSEIEAGPPSPGGDDPWERRMILSFDGGGVKGYSSLLILKRLMCIIEQIEYGYLTPDSSVPPLHPNQSSNDYPWDTRQAQHRPRVPNWNIGECSIEDDIDNTLMREIKDFKPHHYFDYMAGISTGGLSAMMLGRMEQTVDQALKHYDIVGEKVFSHPRFLNAHVHRFAAVVQPKYSTTKMEGALKQVIEKSLEENLRPMGWSADTAPLRHDPERCQTLVISYGGSISVRRAYIFRSYDHHYPNPRTPTATCERFHNPGPAHQHPIWFVGRATSAAPGYFEPAKSSHFSAGEKTFRDGAIVSNNPSEVALREIRQRHPRDPLILLSIGTGAPGPDGSTRNTGSRFFSSMGNTSTVFSSMKDWLDVGKCLARLASDSDLAHSSLVEDIGKQNHPKTSYYRLNVPFNSHGDSLKDVPLDEWVPRHSISRRANRILPSFIAQQQPLNTGSDTKEKIANLTKAYLRDPDVQRQLIQCAWKLVKVRRERAKTPQWEQYACRHAYFCPDKFCEEHKGTRFGDREELHQHGTSFHRIIVTTSGDHDSVCVQRECSYYNHPNDEQYIKHSHSRDGAMLLSQKQFDDWLDRGRSSLTEAFNTQTRRTGSGTV